MPKLSNNINKETKKQLLLLINNKNEQKRLKKIPW
jgi:hypothetical protein